MTIRHNYLSGVSVLEPNPTAESMDKALKALFSQCPLAVLKKARSHVTKLANLGIDWTDLQMVNLFHPNFRYTLWSACPFTKVEFYLKSKDYHAINALRNISSKSLNYAGWDTWLYALHNNAWTLNYSYSLVSNLAATPRSGTPSVYYYTL